MNAETQKRQLVPPFPLCTRCSPLKLAKILGNEDAVEFIERELEKRAGDPSTSDDLFKAIERNDKNAVDLILSTDKALVDEIFDGGENPLTGKGGITPLIAAVKAGSGEIVRLLIGKGADVNAVDFDGDDPLHHAVIRGDIGLVELLLQNGADVNNSCEGSFTALSWAILKNDPEMVMYLISKGADVNMKGAGGMTPLMQTVSLWSENTVPGNKEKIIRLLLDNGADLSVKNNRGNTAYDEAVKAGFSELTAILDIG